MPHKENNGPKHCLLFQIQAVELTIQINMATEKLHCRSQENSKTLLESEPPKKELNSSIWYIPEGRSNEHSDMSL